MLASVMISHRDSRIFIILLPSPALSPASASRKELKKHVRKIAGSDERSRASNSTGPAPRTIDRWAFSSFRRGRMIVQGGMQAERQTIETHGELCYSYSVVEDHNYEAGNKMNEFILSRPFVF